jgi:SagB-type dehydrogenase family enzyme
MRIKRSGAVVLLLEHDQVVFHNFLAQTTFAANAMALEVLRLLHSWTEPDTLHAKLKGYSRTSIDAAVKQLVDLGVVLVQDSPATAREAEYERSWQWGPLAAAYHFGTQGEEFVSDEDSESMLRELAKVSPSPPLYQINPAGAAVTPALQRDHYDEPFRTMARRRTNRVMLDYPIGFDVISDCFLFSMAITAMLDLPGIGELPLKMTPSGGARNPFEGYLLTRRVDGLAPGVHHYSAMERSFALVRGGEPPAFPPLLGEQEWTANAPAVIVLVANFDRPMWKYHDPSAYRVTVIEAGHIAQNMILAATSHGIAANPTALLATGKVHEALGLRRLVQAPLYALVLGKPAPFDDDEASRAQAA